MPFKDPEARKAYEKAWRERNREHRAAVKKAWATANFEAQSAKQKEWRQANKEHVAAVLKANHLKNRELRLANSRAYYLKNKEACRAYMREWQKANPHVVNALDAKRRAQKLKATPKWANEDAIRKIYAEAAFLTQITGEQHHVDHIVPLQSKLVCGLHWEANLQVLSQSENCAKQNRHWPDMP